MQGRQQANETQQVLDGYEQILNSFAEQAKTFWKSMGPAGEPMAMGVESFIQMQRAYLRWLGQAMRSSGMPLPPGLSFDNWPGAGNSEGGGWDYLP
jgi:hypothetical protein